MLSSLYHFNFFFMNIFDFLHENINIPLLTYLNWLTQNEWIASIVYMMADLPIFIIPIFLVSYWIYFHSKKNTSGKHILLFILYSTIFAITISICIQMFVHLERPETSLEGQWKLILAHIPDASFPSDHASVWVAFLVSLFLFWFYKIGLVSLVLFIIMLFSRIAGGVHWPLDIVAGTLIGILSGFLVYKSQNLTIFKQVNRFVTKIASYFKL